MFWFNPALWLYKLALREIHEYLADEQAANRDNYASFLVLYAKNAAIRSISNQFYNSSLLKHRIKMIYKGRTSRWFRGKYLLLVPFVTVLVMITAARKQIVENKNRQNAATPTTTKPASKKAIVVTGKEVNAKEVTIRGKKKKALGASKKGKNVAAQQLNEGKTLPPTSQKSPGSENKEPLQFSSYFDNLAPKNPFEDTGESGKFQNFSYNNIALNYSDIIPRRLTVIEPPQMKFHRYGFTIGRPVLRAVDMKFKVK